MKKNESWWQSYSALCVGIGLLISGVILSLLLLFLVLNRPGEETEHLRQQLIELQKPPAKTDQERMVGHWVIVNDDSKRKGEVWAITDRDINEVVIDETLIRPDQYGFKIVHSYGYRLDASKNPKQIDIIVRKMTYEYVGVIKGIYVLDGDELRVCIGEMAKDDEMPKDRPTAFPKGPKPGEVLILQKKQP
jgi:uncharacterized protein (TIGR03067 family)